MLDKRNPENPAVVYGDGLNAAIADVTAIQVRRGSGVTERRGCDVRGEDHGA